MQRRGKLIVLGIALLAAALAAGNVAYQLWLGGPAMEYFGAPAARMIVDAPRVEALRLGPRAGGGAETLQAGSRPYAVLEAVDASGAKGLLHIRRALITGRLYDWEAEAPADIAWGYALRFRGEAGDEVTLLFSEDCLTLARIGARPVAVRPNEDGISPLRAFVQEQFETPDH